MRQQVWVSLLALGLLLSSLACAFPGMKIMRGSGKVETEKRHVHNFDGVVISGIGNLYIEVGKEEGLTIEAEDNLLPYLTTEVHGNTLEIGTQRGINLHPKKPVNFYLTVKELDKVEVSGTADVETQDLEAERFSVDISGSSSIKMAKLTADRLKVNISGSGKLDIAGGGVGEQNVTVSGSGEYRAKTLESNEADIHISGSGSAVIWVYERLDVEISGNGSVRYAGNPAIDTDISGSGSVQPISE
ncbi:MAG: DUF2807 domain-containing protein [Anaerolineae bacterium]|nr:DUF2807 domain-containing protein [Anaerolineae bacterium]